MMISTHKSILVHIFTPKVEKKWRILRRDFLREKSRYVLVPWSLVFFTPPESVSLGLKFKRRILHWLMS